MTRRSRESRTRRSYAILVCTLAVAVAACDDDDPTGPPDATPAAITIVSGNNQESTAGTNLPEDLVVRVTDAGGAPVPGATISWAVVSGGGSIFPGTNTTDAAGQTAAAWVLGDAIGQQEATATVGGLPPATFTATATPAVDLNLCGTISADLTLPDVGEPYVVCSSGVSVQATLTVQPGVQISVQQGANIRVRSNGVLRAVGTAAAPIRILGSSPVPGHWGGIWIESASDQNELTRVEVAYGGGGDRTNLEVSHGARVKVTNSTFRDGADFGIIVTAASGELPEFSSNQFRDNAIAAIRIHANQIRFMDAASTASGNGKDVIEVTGGTLTEPQAWPRTSFPYLLTNGIGVSTDVVVEPGFHMLMEERFSMNIRVRTDGSFRAVGTEELPIRFIGETPTPGSWGGLWFESDREENELTWVEVAYGGSSDRSNLEVALSARVRVTNSIFRDGADFGIRVTSSGASLPGFASNEFRGNATGAVQIFATQMRFIDAASTASDNGRDVIEVRGGTLTEAQSWPRTSFPFLLTNGISVSADVVVEPGFEMLMQQLHSMNIRVRTDGSFSAVGTPADPIRFIGETGTPGEWGGIWFESDHSANEVNYAEVAHGGSGNFSNIHISGGAAVTVRNSTIRDGAQWGIYVASSTSVLVHSNNTFINNASGDIRWP